MVPVEDCVLNPSNTDIFSFPFKAPEDSITRNELTAEYHLELWKVYQDYWCEHKPSVTVTVKENEWPSVGAWVWNNLDKLSGIAFLPYSDHTYRQAPYQDISEREYTDFLTKMPSSIDWSRLAEYEHEDNTVASQELACAAGVCEI